MFYTNQLIIRRFTQMDADDFFQMNSHPDVMRYIRAPKNREECDAFLQENIRLYQDGSVIGRYHVAEKATGIFAGSFSVLMMPDRDAYHVGYALMPWAQGRGWAKELLKTGLEWLVEHNERPAIYAITEPVNLPSVSLLQKAGFQQLDDIIDHGKTLSVFVIQRSAISQ